MSLLEVIEKDEHGTINLENLDAYRLHKLDETHTQELDELKCRQAAEVEAFQQCHAQYIKEVQALATGRYAETYAHGAYCISLNVYGHSHPLTTTRLNEYLYAREFVRKAEVWVQEWHRRLEECSKP
jgi:hypothetical protein